MNGIVLLRQRSPLARLLKPIFVCDALATIAELTAVVREEGYVLPTGDGGRKGNPLLRSISEQSAQAMKLLASFGLTPLGRMSVDVKPELAKENPFAELMKQSLARKSAPSL
jgi:P27 family predicted phage terminase small subunit